MNLYGDSFTLVHANLITGYGGVKVRDWTNATRATYAGAVQPQSGIEDVQGRQVTVTSWRLHCAPGVGVQAVDRIEWRGGTYEVTAEPEAHSMGGLLDHIEVRLGRVSEAAV